MASSGDAIVIDDSSSDGAETPAKVVPFEVVARGAASAIFGKRQRGDAAAGAHPPCKARKGETDAAAEPPSDAASPSTSATGGADASPGTASVEACDGPARAAPEGVSPGDECRVGGRADAPLEQAPAQAPAGGWDGPAGANDVEVKTESDNGHWERDAEGNRKWVPACGYPQAQAVSGPIAERAAGNDDSARVLSYNKKEGREKSKLKPSAFSGLSEQPTAVIQHKKDATASKVWTPSAVGYWTRLVEMCEDGLLEGAAWQREGSSLVGKRARSSKKTKGKRDGFIVAWCSRVVAQEPLPFSGAGLSAQEADKQEREPAPEPPDQKLGVGIFDLADQPPVAGAARELPVGPATSSLSSAQTNGGGGNSDEAACGEKSGSNPCVQPIMPAVKRRRKNEDAVELNKDAVELVVGSRVKGLWRASEGGRVWYAGTVQKVKGSDVFSILYDDGDVEDDVKICHLKPMDPPPVALVDMNESASMESSAQNLRGGGAGGGGGEIKMPAGTEGADARPRVQVLQLEEEQHQQHQEQGSSPMVVGAKTRLPSLGEMGQLALGQGDGSPQSGGSEAPDRSKDVQHAQLLNRHEPADTPDWLGVAKTVVNRLMQHRKAAAFLQPVDPEALQLPDYRDLITNPMDLGTIFDRLRKTVPEGGYSAQEAFVADVCLTFDNAIEYNGKQHPVGMAATDLRNAFERLWRSAKSGTLESAGSSSKKDARGPRMGADTKVSNAEVKALEAQRTFLIVFFDGKTEVMTYEMACTAIQEVVRASHSNFTYGFTLEFALREGVAKKSAAAVSAAAVTGEDAAGKMPAKSSAAAGCKDAPGGDGNGGPKVEAIDMSINNSSSHNMNGTSYTTSISKYDTAWDSMAGDFIHRKIMGQREINGQTALSADCTDIYFPVLASIFNRFPLTKTELPFKDEETGQVYILSAIAYNRRVWMRTGSCTEFHHGGLMLAQGWSRFRKAHGLGVGDTVILSRNEDNELIIGYRRGADPELLNSLSSSHYAVRAQMSSVTAAANALRDSDKRMSIKPSKYLPEKFRAGGKGKGHGRVESVGACTGAAKAEVDDREPIMTLAAALREYGDRSFLTDWRPRSIKHRAGKTRNRDKAPDSANKQEDVDDEMVDDGSAHDAARPVAGREDEAEASGSGSGDIDAESKGLVHWERIVFSEITEVEANFEYIKRNHLFKGDDDFARTQLFRRVNVLLNHAAANFCQAEPCSCSNGGKCFDFRNGPGGKAAAVAAPSAAAGASDRASSLPEPEVQGGAMSADGEAAGGEPSSAERAKKPSCTICNDTGWKSGDDEAKRQLQDGPPFQLRVVAAEGAMGSGVRAQELIPKGSAVCEYTGELIRGQEMKIREKVYMAAGLYYLFDLEVGRYCSMPWCVDATRKGNVARFVNHRCGESSNCEIKQLPSSVMYKRDDAVPGRLALWAKRDILPGEFLNYDYKELSDEWEEMGYTLRKVVVCKCGSPQCKGWVF